MKTKAVRIYGKEDLRLDEFELPEMKDDEILAKVVSDSVCMSTYKLAMQGADHKRAPKDIDKNPTIVGHEFCGEILEVGSKWADKFKAGDRFVIQPNIQMPENVYAAPGYSFRYFGGAAQYVIIPNAFMERNCLLPYNGAAFYLGSTAEPMSCIVAGAHVSYHSKPGKDMYKHEMGIVEGGKMALLAGVGAMGLGTIDYSIHGPRRPAVLVVTDIDQARLDRAASIFSPEEAKKCGVELTYVNTGNLENVPEKLMEIAGGAFDDVFVYAPVPAVIEQGDKILGYDGCLNFFAGPTNPALTANFNFYNVHYNKTHIAGSSGGNTDDLIETVEYISNGTINPSAMITHVGGLDVAAETTINLPNIKGGKKLIYNHISMPLTAIADMKDSDDPVIRHCGELCDKTNGLWNPEAEEYLLANGKAI